jgi:hypothetical protein
VGLMSGSNGHLQPLNTFPMGLAAAARRCGAERIGAVEHVSQCGAASLIPALASSTCSTARPRRVSTSRIALGS